MWWRCITRNGGTTGVKALPTLEHLKLVSRLIPDISQQWDQLVDIWGEDASRGMCGVLIFFGMAFFSFRSTLSRCFCFFPYISMPNLHLRHRHQPPFDPSSPRQIFQTILHPSQSHLLPSPQLLPDTPTHTLGMIKNHEYSSTLLAFCGSRHVSSVLESAVVLVWRDTNIMDFKSECHGPSYKPGKGAGDGLLLIPWLDVVMLRV